jgi:hypothetical protein
MYARRVQGRVPLASVHVTRASMHSYCARSVNIRAERKLPESMLHRAPARIANAFISP